MEIIFQVIFEVFLELMMYVVPEDKVMSKKLRIISVTIAIAVLLGVFALFIWGCVLIVDYDNKLGSIPITIAIVIAITQIIAGIILRSRK